MSHERDGFQAIEDGNELKSLRAEIDRLRLDARRVYGADGTSELLDSPEEVVRLRVEVAAKLERLTAEVEQYRGLLRQICDGALKWAAQEAQP